MRTIETVRINTSYVDIKVSSGGQVYSFEHIGRIHTSATLKGIRAIASKLRY